jgi:polar amino acid transport system substrate-binding protein
MINCDTSSLSLRFMISRLRGPLAQSGWAKFAGIAILGLLACSCQAIAAPPLVFAFKEMPPWKTVEDGHYTGAYTEIVRELARRLDLPLEIRPCPLKRCLYMMETGDASIIIGVQDTAARRPYLHFLQAPYRRHSADKVFYVLKDKGPQIRSYAELAPLRIGVTYSAAYFERFDQDKTLTKDEAANMGVSFRKLMLGRVDAVVAAEDQGEAELAMHGLEGKVVKAAFRVTDPTPRSIAISRKSPYAARLADFERAMTAMDKDGTLAALYKRYYYDAWDVPPDSVQIR